MRSSSPLAFILFASTAAVIAFGLHLYLYRRLAGVLAGTVRARRAAALIIFVLGTLFAGAPALARLGPGGPHLLLARVGYVWWALAFYLFVCQLAVDVVDFFSRRFLRPEPPVNPARREFLLGSARMGATALAASATGFGVWEAYSAPEVSEVAIKLPGLPASLSGLTLVQLTDIHAGAWVDRRFVQDLVERTHALRPDLVAVTGDLVDGTVADLRPVIAPLATLRPRYGTFFVTGNHEFYSGADPWCEELERMGLRVLRNSRTSLGDGGGSLDLIGVDDWSAREHGFHSGYDLEKAVLGRDSSRPAILLAHQPRGVERAAELGIGLQLSGHTHGGQIWPWSLAVRMAFPYFRGFYQVGGLALYVSRGCGFWGPPVRLGAPPEIVKIVLG